MSVNSVEEALEILKQKAQHTPGDEILANLEFVSGIINFSPQVQDLLTTGDINKIKDSVNYMFKSEVSYEIYNFITFLADENILYLLSGDMGKTFIERCRVYFLDKKELKFATAIELKDEFKTQIEPFLTNNDPGVRVLYEVDPEINAGFIIKDASSAYDYSFRSNIIYHLKNYIKEKVLK